LSKLELSGWIVFLLSGVAFLSGIGTGDWWIIGGVLFAFGIVAVLAGQGRKT